MSNNKETSVYKFFEDLVYDITEDYRTNENKEYDVKKTIENLYDDDNLWQELTDAVWRNLVEVNRLYESASGLMYISKSGNVYSLLEGITSNNLKSDVIFIFDHDNNKVVQFLYGGFKYIDKGYIEQVVDEYEKHCG